MSFWQRIKNFFSFKKRPQTKPVTNTPGHKPDAPPVVSNLDFYIHLLIGHTASAAGARSFDGKYQEYPYWSIVARIVTRELEFVRMFFRDGMTIRQAVRNAAKGADLLIETHYDAYNGKTAGGTILISPKASHAAKQLAREFLASSTKEFEHSNRGVKEIGTDKNGGACVDEIRKHVDGFLYEGFFGDNGNDFVSPERMAQFLIREFKKIHAARSKAL